MLKDDRAATATWIGKGIAHHHDQVRRDVGSVFFRSSNNNDKLAFLNNMGYLNTKYSKKERPKEKSGSGNKTSFYS
jgi:hypothetical protein